MQTETREVPSQHQETLFYCESDRMLSRVAQCGGGDSPLCKSSIPKSHLETQYPTLGGLEQRGLNTITSRGPTNLSHLVSL